MVVPSGRLSAPVFARVAQQGTAGHSRCLFMFLTVGSVLLGGGVWGANNVLVLCVLIFHRVVLLLAASSIYKEVDNVTMEKIVLDNVHIRRRVGQVHGRLAPRKYSSSSGINGIVKFMKMGFYNMGWCSPIEKTQYVTMKSNHEPSP